MSQTTIEDTVAALRVEIAELRERQKEQDPGILSALRTLLVDLDSYRDGKRAFPRAALLGLIFAYLRPRIILVLGSIAAVFLAGAQIVVLQRQNDLLAQQNVMIGRQERALTAQTVAVLLDGIEVGPAEKNPRVTLLGTYGDIGFEVLVELAASGSPTVALSAREALLKSVQRLESGQSFALLQLLVDDHVNGISALDASSPFAEQSASEAWVVKFQEKDPNKRDFGQQSARPLQELLKRWSPSAAEIANLAESQRYAMVLAIAKYYIEQFDLVEIGGPLMLDSEMTSICFGKKMGSEKSIRNQIIEMAGQFHGEPSLESVTLSALVGVVVERSCVPFGAPIFQVVRDTTRPEMSYVRLNSDQARLDADWIRQWLDDRPAGSTP